MAAVDPKYKMRVNWDGTSGFAQTGADISARIIDQIECWWGRQGAGNLVHKSVGGGLVVMLNNSTGDYSPFNTSSPLTGNLAPDKDQDVTLRVFGRAAQFTAANSEQLDGGDVLDITTGDFSFAFWLNIDALGQFGIINKRDRASATNIGYAVEAQSDGTIDLLLSDGTSVTTISSTTTVSAGEWHFYVVTADRDGNAQIYVDNGAAEGAASIVSQNGTLTNAIAFQLGAGLSSSDDRFYGGRMVAVGHWGKLLSSAERTFLWRDGDGVRYKDIGLTGDGSTLKTSLNAWYDLQEESGNRADSENSNTLTDTNTVTVAEGIPNISLWQGFLEEVEPLPGFAINRARLKAVGSLTQVNRNKIRLAMATSEATGAAIGRMLDEANWPAAARTIDTGLTTMSRFWLANDISVLTGLRSVERTESGFIVESKDGRIAFEDRRHRQKEPHTTSQATFTDSPGGALAYSPPLVELDSRQQLFHVFTAPVVTYTVGSLAVLWTLSLSGAASPPIQPGATITFFASFPNPDSATDAFAVDAWTTPVENTDYEANTQADGAGVDKSGILTVVETKFGNSMKIAITNTDPEVVYLTKLEARGTPITKDDPASVTVEKSATYPRTFPDAPKFLPDIQAADDWANWHAGIFSEVQPLLAMNVIGNRSQVTFNQIMDLDVSDRITVEADNDTGLGINEEFFIEFQHHLMNARTKIHRTSFRLSSVANQDAWTLGVSKLGTETRLAQT